MSPRRVSNSEVSAWNTCQRKYFYEYDLNLEPIKPSDAISRGILGHDILAAYYKARQAGMGHDEAVVDARRGLQRALAESNDLETVTDVDRILQGYWGYRGDEVKDFQVIQVEEMHEVPLTTEASYVMRLDLLVRNMKTGELELWDHKFIYDFWDYDKVNLSGQFPKYIGALRFEGIPVDKCVLNQLRYRRLKNPTATDLYKRTEDRPSQAKIKRALKEQILATQEILAWREKTIEQRQEDARRVLNPMLCKGCAFKNICQAEFDGNDLRFLVQSEYRTKTTYGYNNEEI